MHAVEVVRQSPLIGPKIPVHGLMVDTLTGRLEWLVNGYELLARTAPPAAAPAARMPAIGSAYEELVSRAGAVAPGLNGVEAKIGEAAGKASQWVSEIRIAPAPAPAPAPVLPAKAPAPAAPPPLRIPVPPRIEPPQRGSRPRMSE
jgi:carbonic anhydrase